jgi:alpha-glucoside transport system permease protein
LSAGQHAPSPEDAAAAASSGLRSVGAFVLRLIVAVAMPLFGLAVMWAAIQFLRDENANRILLVTVAIVVGVGGVLLLYVSMNKAVNVLPATWRESVRPWIFVGPALVILGVFLVYPLVNTIFISFKDQFSQEFVGLANYQFVFTDSGMLRAIRNTLGWIIIVPLAATTIGLAFATLADRLGRREEAFSKSLIFMPMAISFAGASITWRLMYSFRPQGFGSNIGLLNAIVIGLGGEPIDWLSLQPWNNLFLMVIMVWMQTGFSMVVLSSAIKAIPDEIIEASRIDGASEWQVFRRIMVPTIRPTIVLVVTYMVINALKVFDIVFVIGSASTNGTEVIAERMIFWFFIGANYGRGAAIAVVLFLAVIPVMISNVRRFREQESIR